MITLDHIRTLSATELRIIAYLSLNSREVHLTHTKLAAEINSSYRQVNEALRSLQSKGLIDYERTYNSPVINKIQTGTIRMLH